MTVKNDTNIATRTPQQKLGDALVSQKVAFSELLPKHVDVDRFIKSAQLAAVRNPDLLKCTLGSIISACIDAAELGLDFTPAKGHAYLVPFRNNKNNTYEAAFMPGYRGFIDLARRSGMVSKIEAHVVYKNDFFEIAYGLEPHLIHRPVLDNNRGEMIGAYAVAWMYKAEPQFEFMSKAEIDGIRARAKTDIVWKSYYTQMSRKCPIRCLFKFLPCSPDIEKAIEADNAVSGIDMADDDGRSRTEQLADLVTMRTEEAVFTDVQADKTEAPPEETGASDDEIPF